MEIYFYIPRASGLFYELMKSRLIQHNFLAQTTINQHRFDEYSTVYNHKTGRCICQVLLNTQAIELTTNA